MISVVVISVVVIPIVVISVVVNSVVVISVVISIVVISVVVILIVVISVLSQAINLSYIRKVLGSTVHKGTRCPDVASRSVGGRVWT